MNFERRALCQDGEFPRNPIANRNKITLIYDLDPRDYEFEEETHMLAGEEAGIFAGKIIIGSRLVVSTPASIDTKTGEIMAAGDQETVIESLAANSDCLPFSIEVTTETTFEKPNFPKASFDLIPVEVDGTESYYVVMSHEALDNIEQTFRLLGQYPDNYISN